MVVKNSGAGWKKGDLDLFFLNMLVEHKFTLKNSFTVTSDLLRKTAQQALAMGKDYWGIVVEIGDYEVIILPFDQWVETTLSGRDEE